MQKTNIKIKVSITIALLLNPLLTLSMRQPARNPQQIRQTERDVKTNLQLPSSQFATTNPQNQIIQTDLYRATEALINSLPQSATKEGYLKDLRNKFTEAQLAIFQGRGVPPAGPQVPAAGVPAQPTGQPVPQPTRVVIPAQPQQVPQAEMLTVLNRWLPVLLGAGGMAILGGAGILNQQQIINDLNQQLADLRQQLATVQQQLDASRTNAGLQQAAKNVAEQLLTRAQQLLTQRQQQIDNLNRAVAAAEQRARDRDAQINQLQQQIEGLLQQRDDLYRQLADAQRERAELRAAIEHLNFINNQLQAQVQQLRLVEGTLQMLLAGANYNLAALQLEKARTTTERQQLEKQMQELKFQYQKQLEREKELREIQRIRFAEKQKQSKQQLEQIQQQLEQKNLKIEDLKAIIYQLESNLNAQREEAIGRKQQVEELIRLTGVKKQQKQITAEEATKLTTALQEEKQNVERIQKDLVQALQTIESLTLDLQKKTSNYEQMTRNARTLAQELTKIRKNLNEREARISQLTEEKSALEREIALLKQQSNALQENIKKVENVENQLRSDLLSIQQKNDLTVKIAQEQYENVERLEREKQRLLDLFAIALTQQREELSAPYNNLKKALEELYLESKKIILPRKLTPQDTAEDMVKVAEHIKKVQQQNQVIVNALISLYEDIKTAEQKPKEQATQDLSKSISSLEGLAKQNLMTLTGSLLLEK